MNGQDISLIRIPEAVDRQASRERKALPIQVMNKERKNKHSW